MLFWVLDSKTRRLRSVFSNFKSPLSKVLCDSIVSLREFREHRPRDVTVPWVPPVVSLPAVVFNAELDTDAPGKTLRVMATVALATLAIGAFVYTSTSAIAPLGALSAPGDMLIELMVSPNDIE